MCHWKKSRLIAFIDCQSTFQHIFQEIPPYICITTTSKSNYSSSLETKDSPLRACKCIVFCLSNSIYHAIEEKMSDDSQNLFISTTSSTDGPIWLNCWSWKKITPIPSLWLKKASDFWKSGVYWNLIKTGEMTFHLPLKLPLTGRMQMQDECLCV